MKSRVRRIWSKIVSKVGVTPGAEFIGNSLETSTVQELIAERYGPRNLKFIRTIGTGSFGRVFVSELKNCPEEVVAVKRLVKTNLVKLKQTEHIKNEKEILGEIDHPFVVSLLNTYSDEFYLYIVMEYAAGGEFFSYLRRAGYITPQAARFYAASIAVIFEYLHSLNVVYRDLKPENMLLDYHGYIKLTDFGFAKRISAANDFKTYTLCGTPEYIAPEVLMNKGHGRGVDWWCLGVLLFEMLCGYPPFTDEDVMKIYQKILAGKILFPRGFDKDARSLVKHLLAHDVNRRFGTLKNGSADVFSHRYLAPMDKTLLVRRMIRAPYKPPIRTERDHTQFAAYREETPEEEKNNRVPFNDNNDPFVDW